MRFTTRSPSLNVPALLMSIIAHLLSSRMHISRKDPRDNALQSARAVRPGEQCQARAKRPSLRQASLAKAFHVPFEDGPFAERRALAPLADGELGMELEDLPRRGSSLLHHAEMGVADGLKPPPLGRIVHPLDRRYDVLVALQGVVGVGEIPEVPIGIV